MKMSVFSQNLIILVKLKLTWSFQIEAGRRMCRGLCCRSGVSQWFTAGVLDRWGEQTQAAVRVWPEGEFKLERQEGRTLPRLYSHLQTTCKIHKMSSFWVLVWSLPVLYWKGLSSCVLCCASCLWLYLHFFHSCVCFCFLSFCLRAFYFLLLWIQLY